MLLIWRILLCIMSGKSDKAGAWDQSSGVRGESAGRCAGTARDVHPAAARHCWPSGRRTWTQERPGHWHNSRTDQRTEDHQTGSRRRDKTRTPGRLLLGCCSCVWLTHCYSEIFNGLVMLHQLLLRSLLTSQVFLYLPQICPSFQNLTIENVVPSCSHFC